VVRNAGHKAFHYAPKLYSDEIERSGLVQFTYNTEISVNSLTIHIWTSLAWRLLNTVVTQSKNWQSRVNTTIELKNVTTTPDNNGIQRGVFQLTIAPVLSDVVILFSSVVVLPSNGNVWIFPLLHSAGNMTSKQLSNKPRVWACTEWRQKVAQKGKYASWILAETCVLHVRVGLITSSGRNWRSSESQRWVTCHHNGPSRNMT
jgi:hypothetical protein